MQLLSAALERTLSKAYSQGTALILIGFFIARLTQRADRDAPEQRSRRKLELGLLAFHTLMLPITGHLRVFGRGFRARSALDGLDRGCARRGAVLRANSVRCRAAALVGHPIDQVASTPPPVCALLSIMDNSGRYCVRYWLLDVGQETSADSVVLTRNFYALKCADIPLSMPAHAVFVALAHIGLFRDLSEAERKRARR